MANGKGRIIAAGLGAVAVIWLALRIAPAMEQGLDAVLRETETWFTAPFALTWCGSSLRTMALFLLLYGVLLAVLMNDDPNRRPMEEHGSAKWGSSGALCKKYAHPEPTANKQLTQRVAIGLDGRKHRRNLNIMNEWYAKDTSNKIKAVFQSRMSDGKRCSGSIPYGYNRRPGDKQTLVVDPAAAPVVRRIFELAAQGHAPPVIAQMLSEEQILIPSAYTLQYHPEQCNHKAPLGATEWRANTVREILHRQEYLGHTVLRKTVGISFKSDARRTAPEEERLLFEHTHEPIISPELWEQAHKQQKHRMRRNGAAPQDCRLPGLVFCADCGSRMSYETHYYKSGEAYHTFRCSRYAGNTAACTIHHIRESVLNDIVLRAIRKIFGQVIADERGFAEELQTYWQKKSDDKTRQRRELLTQERQRLADLDRLIGSLYEHYITGILPEKQYKSLMQKYSEEQVGREAKVHELEESLTGTSLSAAQIDRFIRLIRQYKTPDELTAGLACALIDKIMIHEAMGRKPDRRQQVDIVYNFIGNFDPPMTAEEINQAAQKAEQDTEKKVKHRTEQQRRRNAAFQAKEKAARRAANNGHKFSQRTCDQCGEAYWPASSTQRFCTPDCAKAHQRHLRTQERQTQREGHTFRQKTCRLCGTPFWPVNGQQELCSEACRKLNRNRRQLEYYYRQKEQHEANR